MDAHTLSGRSENGASVATVVAEAWHTNFALDLGREETAFLAGIHTFLRQAPEPTLSEEILRRIFALVYELAETGTDSEAQRGTHIIGRLKGQGILWRADDAGLVSEGEYTLSELGLALGHYMDNERTLTKRSLTFMLLRMRTELTAVLWAAAEGGSDDQWEEKIIFPLQYVVQELIRMVDQRQRGLDAAHKTLRKEITERVDSDWADAIDSCVNMIRNVDGTLRELNEVLSEHVESIDRQLFDLAAFASQHRALPALVDYTRNQLLRLQVWSSRRYEEWHGYYRNVQVFIRDVVQTDPNNLMRSRLIEQIRHFQERPYGLVLVEPQPFLHLRAVLRPSAEAPLAVPEEILANRELAEYTAPMPDKIELAVAALVAHLREEGEIDILDAVREVAPQFSEEEYFRLLMRATPALLTHGITLSSILEQVWVSISARLHAQSLELHLRENREGRVAIENAVGQPLTPSEVPAERDPLP
jgi:chromosome partition protein MukF